MRSLRELQRATRRSVTGGSPHPALVAANGASPEERLAVYADAYAARLTAALGENFPALAAIMGDEAFADLAARYIAAHPSRRPSIRWFGDALAAFAEQHPDVPGHPALADLARFEWALGCAFDAPAAPPFDASVLRRLPPARWPALRLWLQPSVRLLDLRWAIEPAWQAVRGDAGAAAPAPHAHAHAVLVWREGLEARWRILDAIESTAIRRLAAGARFGEVCESLVGEAGADEAPRLAAACLARWSADGLLAAAKPRGAG